MEQYHGLLKDILEKGDVQFEPRTQEYILGISAHLSTYDLREGFPLPSTKKVPIRLPAEELFWKLRGERNVKSLFDRDVHIWDANAFDRYLKKQGLIEEIPKHSAKWNEAFTEYQKRLSTDADFAATAGDLGPVYGFQWIHGFTRDGIEINQLENLLKSIKEKPGSRYHVMNAWNPSALPDMALGPCPFWHQFTVYGENLDLTVAQRSCDVFLGVPFNITQDALLTHLVAKETGLKPRYFHHSLVNVHAYLGVPPRSEFWTNPKNVEKFKARLSGASGSEFMKIKDWYLKTAPLESPSNERKDHIPFTLEQLSKTPSQMPQIEIADIPLLDIINMPAQEVIKVTDYNPDKWDSKAIMAA